MADNHSGVMESRNPFAGGGTECGQRILEALMEAGACQGLGSAIPWLTKHVRRLGGGKSLLILRGEAALDEEQLGELAAALRDLNAREDPPVTDVSIYTRKIRGFGMRKPRKDLALNSVEQRAIIAHNLLAKVVERHARTGSSKINQFLGLARNTKRNSTTYHTVTVGKARITHDLLEELARYYGETAKWFLVDHSTPSP